MIETILLIDDDKTTTFINKRIVSSHEMIKNIITMDSGIDGLTYLKDIETIKPQLIFLDLNMPTMDGWQFLVEYKKMEPKLIENIELFILTTSTNYKDVLKSREIDCVSGFLNKPLTKDLLDKIINLHFVDSLKLSHKKYK